MITKETLAAFAAARARIDHLTDGPTSQIMAAWLNAHRDVEAMIREATSSDSFDKYERLRRLEIARASIAEAITDAAQTSVDVLTPAARRMIENAADTQEALIATQLPPGVGVSFSRPDPEALAAIMARTTEQITVRNYFLAAEATDAMNTILRVGIAGGLNPNEAAARMIAQTGPVFNGGLARATVIARTEMLDAHRRSTEAHHAANDDILDGWVWMASLNSDRTCISCIAQHGQMHPLDEPGPLDHHQGRCTRLPKTKTLAELGIEGFDDVPEERIETGAEWFANLPEEQQRKILGPTRYEAWQAGDFPVEAWSVRRSSEGWRDSFHAGKLPPGDWRTGAPLAPKPTPSRNLERALMADDQEAATVFKEIYEGRTYAGFTTKVERARKSTWSGSEKMEVSLQIVAPDGAVAGKVERHFFKDADGNLRVSNELMKVSREHRGKGFSTAFSKHSEDALRKEGVVAQELTAGFRDGGYVWARAGYTWDRAKYAGKTPTDVIDDMQQYATDPQVATWIEQLSTPDGIWPEPAEIAASPHGRDILRGSLWEGIKYL